MSVTDLGLESLAILTAHETRMQELALAELDRDRLARRACALLLAGDLDEARQAARLAESAQGRVDGLMAISVRPRR